MENGNEQATLHDTLTATFNEVIPEAPAPVADAPTAAPAAAPIEAPAGETSAQKEARERDEKGRFTPKGIDSVPAQAKTPTPSAQPQATPTPAPAPEAKKINRPSSWKKDHWEAFDKLATENPTIAEYILQRETEAARGVSTYKTEWDKARPFLDAVAPHMQLFAQHGIDPGQQIGKYVEIHKGLAMGSEEQKMSMLHQLISDYKIPVEKMFVQQNGQLFYNPQVKPMAQQPAAQQAFNPQAIENTVRSVIQRERSAGEIASMEKDTAKYPHFAAVRNTMGQLVDAGMASPDDLPGAYEMALALPQHRELYAQQQSQQAAQADADRKKSEAANAQRARAAAVSTRSATPASAPAQARKGLRETIAEQIDATGTGRL